jgi:hypothetical protein
MVGASGYHLRSRKVEFKVAAARQPRRAVQPAAVGVGSLDPSIQARLAKNDQLDLKLVRQENLKAVEEAFPYLKGHVTSDALLTQLYQIRAFYWLSRPLSPQQRILLRSEVKQCMQHNQLPQAAVDGLVKLLEAHGAM